MIKLINESNNNNLRELVINELKSESDIFNDNSLDFSYTEPDLPNVIFCTDKKLNITFSLDCKNPSKSTISYDNILSSNYTSPDDFFNKISELDKISDTFRYLWYDFTSAISNVRGNFK